jgi:hypothetical protein
MSNEVLIGCGFMVGACATLGWMWWEFKNAPLIDDEDYEDWNGR